MEKSAGVAEALSRRRPGELLRCFGGTKNALQERSKVSNSSASDVGNLVAAISQSEHIRRRCERGCTVPCRFERHVFLWMQENGVARHCLFRNKDAAISPENCLMGAIRLKNCSQMYVLL